MSSDNPTSEILAISARRDGGHVVVELVGELDYHGAGRLDVEVGELLSEPVDTFEIDATALTFVDSSGLRSLLHARAAAEAAGASFLISTAAPLVERVIELAGLSGLLNPTAPDPDPA